MQIAFWQLIKLRRGDLSKEQWWLDLFEVWRLRYMARQEARRAEVDKLWAERDALFAERASAPADEQPRIEARLSEIGREIAR